MSPTRRGYALAALAATLWALNASIARSLLDDGLPALRLTQLRSTGAFAALVVALAISRPELLRVRREDVPALAFVLNARPITCVPTGRVAPVS